METALNYITSEMLADESLLILIGQIFFNTEKTSESGVSKWKEFILQKFTSVNQIDGEEIITLPSYIEDIDEYIKNNFCYYKPTFHTWDSIAYLLDNVFKCEDYIKFKENEYPITICYESISDRNFFKYIHGQSMLYIKSDAKKFYVFSHDKNIWMESGTEFTSRFIEKIIQILERIAKLYRDQISTSRDESDRERIENLCNRVYDALKFASKTGNVESIHRKLAMSVRERGFMDRFDSYDNYTGVKNGVLIAHGGRLFFRNSLPEDFISKQMNVPYLKEIDKQKEAILTEWFNRLFPEEDYNKYMYKLLASLLISGNDEKGFYILSGETGNNSKSTFVKVIENMLGDKYAKKVNANLFTRVINSSHQANSSMCDLAECRFCSWDEPEAQEHFYSSNIKSLSGNDRVASRRLNKESKNPEVKSKIFGTCNRVPPFKDPDEASKERLRILPFITRWSDKAPEDLESQIIDRHYKIDKTFTRSVAMLGSALLSKMVEYYPIYFEEKLTDIPQAVKEATDEYWSGTDYFSAWGENFKLGKKGVDILTMKDMEGSYGDFCHYFRLKYPRRQCPEFEDYVYGMGGIHKVRKWGGQWNGLIYTPPIQTSNENTGQTTTIPDMFMKKTIPSTLV